MNIPEHRRAMMEHEDRQDLGRTLAEAMERGRLVTLRVFKPTGIEEVYMVPQPVVYGKLRGLDRDGDRGSVAMMDVLRV